MKKQIVVLALLILGIMVWAVRARASEPCSGEKYDGHPALVQECRHSALVKSHSADTHGQSGEASALDPYPGPEDAPDPYPPPGGDDGYYCAQWVDIYATVDGEQVWIGQMCAMP